MQSTPVTPSPESTTLWARMTSCCCSKKTQQCGKMAFWGGAAMGAMFIPVPLLSSSVMGASLFMMGHEMAQHPSSNCMTGAYQPIAPSRTWKHLTIGAVFGAVGGLFGEGMGMLFSSALAGGAGAIGATTGAASGLLLAYSDKLFKGNYAPAAENPLLQAAATEVSLSLPEDPADEQV